MDLTTLNSDPLLIVHGDCVDVMRSMPENSVDAICTDPPYGLEFMGQSWDDLSGGSTKSGWRNENEADREWIEKQGGEQATLPSRMRKLPDFGGGRRKNWQAGGGFSKPGIGDRAIPWASYSATSKHGAANPTCGTCGGRARGAKKCECAEPNWKPIGKRRDPANEGLPDDMTGSGMGNAMHAMQEWHYEWAVEAYRVLKPGGYLLAFGGSRTYHRLASAVEDAGFEIRDMIEWMYGSGFPKSLDVSKAIDKSKGAEREVVGKRTDGRYGYGYTEAAKKALGKVVAADNPTGFSGEIGVVTAPATDLAQQWQGWGTALKPAHEPVVVARKPLIGTVAANVERWGVGALNIDGTRIAFRDAVDEQESMEKNRHEDFGSPAGQNTIYGDYTMVPKKNYHPPLRAPQSDPSKRKGVVGSDLGISRVDADKFQQVQRESIERTATLGRWPANVVLAHSPDCEQVGTERVPASGYFPEKRSAPQATAFGVGQPTPGGPRPSGDGDGMETVEVWRCVPGCAVRLLDEQSGNLAPGAAPQRNNVGFGGVYTEGTPRSGVVRAERVTLDSGGASRFFYTAKASRGERGEGNTHPTVKPVELMRWLVRLVTPRGGIVLDPFAGSGTTGQAALAEGFKCVLIEKEREYVEGIEKWRGAMQVGLGL